VLLLQVLLVLQVVLVLLVLLLSGFAAAASGQLVLLLLQRMSPGQTEPVLAQVQIGPSGSREHPVNPLELSTKVL
jgi:hypothetical protein